MHCQTFKFTQILPATELANAVGWLISFECLWQETVTDTYLDRLSMYWKFFACRLMVNRYTLSSHCCLKGHWASWALGNLQLSVWVITSPDLGHPGCFQIFDCLPSPTELVKSYMKWDNKKAVPFAWKWSTLAPYSCSLLQIKTLWIFYLECNNG